VFTTDSVDLGIEVTSVVQNTVSTTPAILLAEEVCTPAAWSDSSGLTALTLSVSPDLVRPFYAEVGPVSVPISTDLMRRQLL